MIRKEELDLKSTNGKNNLYTLVWREEKEEYKGIVQLSHGMIEHIGRYEELAVFLARAGFVVVGNDHLGHGKTAKSEEEYGYFPGNNGSETLVKDLHLVTTTVKEKYPNLPVFLLGHSMGSLIARRYIMTYRKELSGVLLLGTGEISKLFLLVGSWLVKAMIWIKGEQYHSFLLELIIFGAYNDRFGDERFGKEWLTKDEEQLEEYKKDKACRFTFSLNGIKVLVDTVSFIQKEKNMKKISKHLPILFMAGTEDPFGGYGRGVNHIYEEYQELQIKDLKIRMYDNDRHELLHETDRETVFKDILSWLEAHL